MKQCHSCIHWQFAYDDGIEKFGKCGNELFIKSIRVVVEQEIEDIFTEQFTGCVWHEINNKCAVQIKIEHL
jgi:hypothetical protein